MIDAITIVQIVVLSVALITIIHKIYRKEKNHDTNDWFYKRNVKLACAVFGNRANNISVWHGIIPVYCKSIPDDNKAGLI